MLVRSTCQQQSDRSSQLDRAPVKRRVGRRYDKLFAGIRFVGNVTFGQSKGHDGPYGVLSVTAEDGVPLAVSGNCR